MNYYHIHYPSVLPAKALDEYLARGWYRMQQTIFTTDIIIKNEMVIPVFWIRLVLKRYRPSRSSRKLLELNKDLEIIFTDGTITTEAEELYQVYKAYVDFDVSDTIRDYLVGDAIQNIYKTRCIELRYKGRLVAAGYFDEGHNSVAGILNIYHPDHKQRSLGKLLILLKIAWTIEQGKQFYYPGYISTGISKFDYKLFPDKEATEVFVTSTQQWMPWLSVTKEQLEEWLFSDNGEIQPGNDQ